MAINVKRFKQGGQSKVIIYEDHDRVDVIFKDDDEKRSIVLEKIYNLQQQQELQNIILVKELVWHGDPQKQIITQIILQKAQQTLEEYVKINVPEETEKIQLMHQMAIGVDQLHSNQILHRDLKEDNILIVDNNAKIADLGLVRHMESIDEDIFGTCYNSLNALTEETRSSHYGSPSDIFSLGALFSFIYTGFQLSKIETNIQEKRQKIKRNLENNVGNNKETITKLISKMIETDPIMRIKLVDILKTLKGILSGQETQKKQTENQKESIQQKKIDKIEAKMNWSNRKN